MQENSLIKQNILKYLDLKGITPYRFYKENDVTRGILTQNNGITEENLLKFVRFAQDISLEWLLTGEGPMLKKEQPSEDIETPLQKPSNDLVAPLLAHIDSITRENERLKIENARLESELERMRSSATDAHSEPSARAV